MPAVPAAAQTAADAAADLTAEQITLEQQRQIRSNQRQLDSQMRQIDELSPGPSEPPGSEKSPATGELIDRGKLPKGPLSGIFPESPFGFSYGILLGCFLDPHPARCPRVAHWRQRSLRHAVSPSTDRLRAGEVRPRYFLARRLGALIYRRTVFGPAVDPVGPISERGGFTVSCPTIQLAFIGRAFPLEWFNVELSQPKEDLEDDAMKGVAKSCVAAAIVVAEIASVGMAVAPATAQETTQRQLRQQQRLIQEQQRQIQNYQRQLAAQQQAAPQEDLGLLGVLGCPRGYTYSWFGKGCYPNLPAPVVITSPR